MTDPITLPSLRGVKIDKPRLIDFGGALKPIMGGDVQHLMRLGTRHAIDITVPTMPAEPDGRIFAARLRRAKVFGALTAFRQDGMTIGTPGNPVVDGAGQSGFSLAMRAFTVAYTVREGQYFSLVTGGRRYLYFATTDVTIPANGKATIPLFPMLRKIPADGDACEFAAPMIEGSLSGNEVAFTRLTSPHHDFGTITITEDA